jgi:hypothetical protein
MHPGARRVAIHELPKLPTRGKKRAAGATYHAGIVFFRIGINDGWRAATGASEFFRHLTFLSSFNVMAARTPLNKREMEIIVPFGIRPHFHFDPGAKMVNTWKAARPKPSVQAPHGLPHTR